MSTRATGTFEFKSWEEQPYSEVEGGAKLTRASVTNTFTGDVDAESTLEYLMVYVNDSRGSFMGLEHLIGRIGDRAGSFVLHQMGTFVGEIVTATWSVVPDSGTGELTGLHGEGGFVARHGESATPFTLDHDFA